MATSAPGTVSLSSNAWLNSITWGDKWNVSVSRITYSFDTDASNWTNTEKVAFRAALATFSKYTNLRFTEMADNDTSNLEFFRESDAQMGGDGTLAYQYGPNGDAEDGDGHYNYQGFGWAGGLNAGGYGFMTIIHELGHGLGLAHPHDDGGISTIMPGVTRDDAYDAGTYNLNNPLFTVMSYRDDADSMPGTDGATAYGWVATPMAFDIAVLQRIYGSNTAYNATNTTYRLDTSRGIGNTWEAIWDGGGTDQIIFTGRGNATIDLRSAPLTGANAGGYTTSSTSADGGYVIAARVVIENAAGSSGADKLTGNQVNNILIGNGGNDSLNGGTGNDRLDGGTGNDILIGGTGNDRLDGGAGKDLLTGGTGADVFVFDRGDYGRGAARDLIRDFSAAQRDKIDLHLIDANTTASGNQAFRFVGSAGFSDRAGELRYSGGVLQADLNGDGRVDFEIGLSGVSRLAASNFVL